jgi:hypothetical protein
MILLPLPPAALPQACLPVTSPPKPSCEGTNKFLIALVSSSLVWLHDPYQKFNPITKEACFHRGLSTVLHYPSRGLSLTGYLCEFVCTSGYLPPLIGIHRSVFVCFYFCKCNSIAYLEFTTYVSHFEQFASPNIISHTGITVAIIVALISPADSIEVITTSLLVSIHA